MISPVLQWFSAFQTAQSTQGLLKSLTRGASCTAGDLEGRTGTSSLVWRKHCFVGCVCLCVCFLQRPIWKLFIWLIFFHQSSESSGSLHKDPKANKWRQNVAAVRRHAKLQPQRYPSPSGLYNLCSEIQFLYLGSKLSWNSCCHSKWGYPSGGVAFNQNQAPGIANWSFLVSLCNLRPSSTECTLVSVYIYI